VARLGGDEFVLLLVEIADLSEAERITQALLEELRSPISLGDRDIVVTGSIGIVLGTPQYEAP